MKVEREQHSSCKPGVPSQPCIKSFNWSIYVKYIYCNYAANHWCESLSVNYSYSWQNMIHVHSERDMWKQSWKWAKCSFNLKWVTFCSMKISTSADVSAAGVYSTFVMRRLKARNSAAWGVMHEQSALRPLESHSSLDSNQTLIWLSVVLQCMCDLCASSQLISVHLL